MPQPLLTAIIYSTDRINAHSRRPHPDQMLFERTRRRRDSFSSRCLAERPYLNFSMRAAALSPMICVAWTITTSTSTVASMTPVS